jgi:hypothetical protein
VIFTVQFPSLLKRVTNWGDIQWQSMKNSFAYAKDLNITATDTPGLSQVTITPPTNNLNNQAAYLTLSF